MGMNLTAFERFDDAGSVSKNYEGEIIHWDEVKNIVSRDWLNKEK
jgi:hypothetical protein